jgi:hypothetical protein
MDAYLDESGEHEGAAICVIAGYFGSKKALKLLQKRWRQALLKEIKETPVKVNCKERLGGLVFPLWKWHGHHCP